MLKVHHVFGHVILGGVSERLSEVNDAPLNGMTSSRVRQNFKIVSVLWILAVWVTVVVISD